MAAEEILQAVNAVLALDKQSHHFPKQKEGDCGENAVKSILSMFGQPTDDVKIATEEGTSPRTIANELKDRGLVAEVRDGVQFEELRSRSIAYYPEDDHYVAIEAVSEDEILINDSSKEHGAWESLEAFEKKWDGWVIEVRNKIIAGDFSFLGVE